MKYLISFISFCLFILWVNPFVSFSQLPVNTIQGEKLDYIMPSPEGASLVKLIENQPGIATGVPNVTVPLFAIPNTPISINLSYNTSGLLVNELPSIAGLGWRLESGGMITRVVVGLPDDYPVYGYLNSSASMASFMGKSINDYSDADISVLEPVNFYSYDDSPDLFYYDIFGIKGKFVIDHGGNIISFPKNNLNITYEAKNGRISTFRVTFDNGTYAKFIVTETCLLSGHPTITSSFSTSWGISSFESNEQIIAAYNYGFSAGLLWNFTPNVTADEESLMIDDLGIQKNSKNTVTRSFVQFPLMSISTVDIKVSFSYTRMNGVSFLQSGQWLKLEKIEQTLNNDETGGAISAPSDIFYRNQLKKYYSFYYHHAGTSTTTGRDSFFLEKLSFHAANATLPYVFEYYPGNLPVLGSTAVDLWGYFNGENNGTSIIPSVFNIGELTTIPIPGLTPIRSGANRNANLGAAQVGCLKSVLNPEGLKTEYVYGLNSFEYKEKTISGAGLRINAITRYDETKVIETERFYYNNVEEPEKSSGELITYPKPIVGINFSGTQINGSTWNGKGFYLKTSLNGVGLVPFQRAVSYSNVSVVKNNMGITYFYFDLPVSKSSSNVIPVAYSWLKSPVSVRSFISNGNLWYLNNQVNSNEPTLINFWNYPFLTRKVEKDIQGRILRETYYAYEPLSILKISSSIRFLPRFSSIQRISGIGKELIGSSSIEQGESLNGETTSIRYLYNGYKVYFLSAWKNLKTISETTYNTSGIGSTTQKQFSYKNVGGGEHYRFIGEEKTVDLQGTGYSSIYNYCFEPAFEADLSSPNITQQYYECLDNARAGVAPNREALPSELVEQCHLLHVQSSSNLSPEVEAITRLNQRGVYNEPIEILKVREKSGTRTLVEASFTAMVLQQNYSVKPTRFYKSTKLVPLNSFRTLRLKNVGGVISLDFDSSYKKIGEVTLYSENGNALETLGADGVYTSFLYIPNWPEPVVKAANCRYDKIKRNNPQFFDDTYIRSANPSARITTYRQLFPYGTYEITDERGRKSYSIYNVIGEVVGVKDHDKNLRTVNVTKRRHQLGDFEVLVKTDPDSDNTINLEYVDPKLRIDVLGGSRLYVSDFIKFGIEMKPAYTYFVSYDGAPEVEIKTNEFSHKFETTGNHTITVKAKAGDVLIESVSKTILLEKLPLSVNFSYTSTLCTTNHQVEEFHDLVRALSIRAHMNYGTGNYTATWRVGNKQGNTYSYSGGASTSSFHATEKGIYFLVLTITDGVETFSKTWTFSIQDYNGEEIDIR